MRLISLHESPLDIKQKRKGWLPLGKSCALLIKVSAMEVIISIGEQKVFGSPVD